MPTITEFSLLFEPRIPLPEQCCWTPAPRKSKTKSTAPRSSLSSNSNSTTNTTSPSKASTAKEHLKRVARKLSHAWKLYLPPPPTPAHRQSHQNVEDVAIRLIKDSNVNSASTTTLRSEKLREIKVKELLKTGARRMGHAWKLYLPPPPLELAS
ncbi:hypothetical protein N431DRAFT_534479 [Stipitochalara longipes BDJ]|nr:hypothetical protein N431DRAFT_534479 [Stipitochalara longipes BDJ]